MFLCRGGRHPWTATSLLEREEKDNILTCASNEKWRYFVHSKEDGAVYRHVRNAACANHFPKEVLSQGACNLRHRSTCLKNSANPSMAFAFLFLPVAPDLAPPSPREGDWRGTRPRVLRLEPLPDLGLELGGQFFLHVLITCTCA